MDPKKPLSLPAVRLKWRYDFLTIAGFAAAVAAYAAASVAVFPGWGVIVPLFAFWSVLGSLSGTGTTRMTIIVNYAVMHDSDVRQRLPHLWEMVDRHARAAGIRTPEVYILRPNSPAACAWGTARTRQGVGLRLTLITLPPPFISAMLAHEIAHLKNRDESVFNVIAALIRGLSVSMVLLLVLSGLRLLREMLASAPTTGTTLSSLLIILAVVATWLILSLVLERWIPKILQQHEFAADQLGSVISGDPVSLICALAALEAHEGMPVEPQPDDAPRTHPPLQARLTALMELWLRMQRRTR